MSSRSTMDANTIRQTFLDFFASKQHEIVPSAPLVVKNDPTLMFINAGMNQFKDIFLGDKEADNPRVADTQKCLRVSGKHNDLEEVGIDTYHHTLFEMLGNWSFADYFKKEAIDWAWELLTEKYKLDKGHLYATVFEGDKVDNLAADKEAAELWAKHLPKEHILYASKKDNFWEMGETGPCGPCSEIHIDLRPEAERAKVPGHELVNKDHPQVVEIWNLVFMQYSRKADGKLEALPARHVDTGMGFERLVMAIQQKQATYDTDVFQPLIQHVATKSGVKYGAAEKTDIAIRVVADHIRAIAFAIADGQLPSNNKAGYVIRRILRRATRYGYTFLNLKQPFMHELVPVLEQQMGKQFPELRSQKDFITKVISEEETTFLRTLEKGLGLLNSLMSQADNKRTIGGQKAFELYDTFGFPFDLTALIARENNFKVDEEGFQKALQQQKDRSRKAGASEKGDWVQLRPEQPVKFTGYQSLEEQAEILRYREVKEKKKSFYQLVLNRTPFYAEGGGQVGDKGELLVGEERVPVINTQRENDLIIHIVPKLPAQLRAAVTAKVTSEKRERTQANHTATHLLHAALRKVLGEHVAQRGSLVNDELLRFDFSHFSKLTDDELQQVEQEVNKAIRTNTALDEQLDVPIAHAQEQGAMALFGEKYGDKVRVISFGPGSVELCGGTHAPATGNIGLFKIISESSVAAGVRRIEAISGEKAEAYVQEELAQLQQLRDLLKSKDVAKGVNHLLLEKEKLAKDLEKLQAAAVGALKDELAQKATTINGVQVLVAQAEVPNAESLRQLCFDLRQKLENNSPLYLVLAADFDGKPQLAMMLSEQLVTEKGLNAGKHIRDLAKNIKGGGGGQPFYATAGGKDAGGIPAALKAAEDLAKELLK